MSLSSFAHGPVFVTRKKRVAFLSQQNKQSALLRMCDEMLLHFISQCNFLSVTPTPLFRRQREAVRQNNEVSPTWHLEVHYHFQNGRNATLWKACTRQ
jgi:hypothetical protein